MNMNHERHEKGKDDHFRDITKMILVCNSIELDDFGRAGR
jgi:hypothetical protein